MGRSHRIFHHPISETTQVSLSFHSCSRLRKCHTNQIETSGKPCVQILYGENSWQSLVQMKSCTQKAFPESVCFCFVFAGMFCFLAVFYGLFFCARTVGLHEVRFSVGVQLVLRGTGVTSLARRPGSIWIGVPTLFVFSFAQSVPAGRNSRQGLQQVPTHGGMPQRKVKEEIVPQSLVGYCRLCFSWQFLAFAFSLGLFLAFLAFASMSTLLSRRVFYSIGTV